MKKIEATYELGNRFNFIKEKVDVYISDFKVVLNFLKR